MDSVLSFLGLLNRGGKTRVGEDVLHSRFPQLLFIAGDASENSKKRFLAFAVHKNVDTVLDYSKEELGLALGFTALSAVLVEDKKASASLKKKLETERFAKK